MLIRNLDYLSIPHKFSMVELNIYQNKYIALVYIKNKGYSLVLKDTEHIDSIFLLKTTITPNNIMANKRDFINVIKILIDKMYSVTNVKEYEKQHQEHVFLRLVEMLTEEYNVKSITERSKLYRDIEKGFIKLEIEVLENKIDSLNKNLTYTKNEFEENKISNKFKKFVDEEKKIFK